MSFYPKALVLSVAVFPLLAPSAMAQQLRRPEVAAQTEAVDKPVESEPAGYEFSFPALGTLVQLKTFSSDEAAVEQAFQAARAEVVRLEGILSDYDSESETRRLTTAAVQQTTAVSVELWEVLAASDRWYHRTDGAFDASLGSVTRLWRQSRRGGKVPEPKALRAALASSGWQHVRLDADRQAIELATAGIYLDFGGIGKGYIVDRVFELLAARGLKTTLVNISGNMRCGLAPAGREGWRIAISPLEKDGQPLRKISVRECAIATSGDLWQFLVIDGVRRSHILDPRTGIGVSGPLSATVIASRATDADALATAACILDIDAAKKLVRELRVTESKGEVPGRFELLVARENEQGEVSVDETDGFPAST